MYPCICLDTVYGVRCSVSVGLCKFFDTWLHWGRFLISDSFCCRFFRDFSFRSRVSFLFSSSPSAWLKKDCSSSATSEEDVVTSMGFVFISHRILRRIFSVTFNSNLERKSAALLTEPAICVFLKLNCNTIACIPQERWNCFRFTEMRKGFVVC